jgi:hypothetical protein
LLPQVVPVLEDFPDGFSSIVLLGNDTTPMNYTVFGFNLSEQRAQQALPWCSSSQLHKPAHSMLSLPCQASSLTRC